MKPSQLASLGLLAGTTLLLGLNVWAQFGQSVEPPAARTVHLQQQLAAERDMLQTLLADSNTPAEKKALAQELLEWNARGVTVAGFERQHAGRATISAVVAPPPNLAEAEAAPPAANVAVPAGSMLQTFSSQRDADASAKATASLGLAKSQQGLETATRESEAKIRDAQTLRDQAGSAALAQRQQDANNAAAQQAAGSMARVLGDSLVQSVQQGAQAAGQAVGGAAGGRVSGAAGQLLPGGGGGNAGGSAAVGGSTLNAGASAAAGQIFGGGGAGAPAATGAASGDGNSAAAPGAAPVTAPAAPAVAADASAPGAGSSKRYIGPPLGAANVSPDRKPRPQVRGLFDALCPKHGKYGGEIGKVTGCPRCAAERHQMWDALCRVHGKYGGQGPITGCPKCAEEAQHLLPRNGLR